MLTHCNAGWLATVDCGTATAPIYLAHDRGLPVHVWVDETRPRNQGAALTAWELGQHGVPHTVIADNAGGHLMQHGLVDMAIVGTDRVTANGDVCNKIGTYLKALAAHDNGVPFYVALPSPTIDFTVSDGLTEIPIEERGADEVAAVTRRHRRRPDRDGAHRAGRQRGRQLRLRRDAGAARHRPRHRARCRKPTQAALAAAFPERARRRCDPDRASPHLDGAWHGAGAGPSVVEIALIFACRSPLQSGIESVGDTARTGHRQCRKQDTSP